MLVFGLWLCLTGAAGAEPARLTVVTYNVEHGMSAQRHEAWQRFCEPLNWRDPVAADPTRRRPSTMTYCDALNGRDMRGRLISRPVHDAQAWQAKSDALAAVLKRADADLILLQEVADSDTVRALVGNGYQVLSTADGNDPPRIAQHVAIAWRPPVVVDRAERVDAIGLATPDSHRMRPGLAVRVSTDRIGAFWVLNVHLKAGCRHGRLGEAGTPDGQVRARRSNACAAFRHQIPGLEAWADAHLGAGEPVILAGDFNRDLARETRERMPARQDGTDPATHSDPGRIASMLAEINDDDPAGAWFELVRTGRHPGRAGCHRAIDSFLVSRVLEPRLAHPINALHSEVIPADELTGLDHVRASDHCAHRLSLTFQSDAQGLIQSR